MKVREEKVKSLIAELAANFLEQESNRTSLITVTSVTISSDFKKATIGLSIFPDSQAETAVNFAKRRANEFRSFAAKKLSLRILPFFEFTLDKGEKNRQQIDNLGQQA